MQLEAIRMVTDHLKHPDLGVNAQLAAVELDADGDYKPTAMAFIGDVTRDRAVAEKENPPALPALYVLEDAPAAYEPNVFTDDHRDTVDGSGVAVAIRYIDAPANAVAAVQGAFYVLRAILRSLETLFREAPDPVGVRNGIQLIAPEAVEFGRFYERVADREVLAVVVVTLKLRDTNP